MDPQRFERRLDPGHPYKPLDFGNGLLAGSVAPDGGLFSLNTGHPTQGYVTLSAIAPFPDAQRHDPAAVRAYRAALARPDAPTFGLRPPPGAAPFAAGLLADAVPHGRSNAGALQIEVTTWAPRPASHPFAAAVQQWRVRNTGDQPLTWDCTWSGQLSLSRASYTQLTESGLLTMPAPTLDLHFDGRMLSIHAPDLDAAAVILGLPPSPPWHQHGDGPLTAISPGQVTIAPGQAITHTLIYALGQTVEQARRTADALANTDLERDLAASLDARQEHWQQLDPHFPTAVRPLVHRAHTYLLDCCALPVEHGTCLLTDHQILPLSWTRDAYFLLQGLFSDTIAPPLDLLCRHLIWTFEIAQRPDGYWGRAYLANGRPKDRIFQLDQQCYPLLELAEYAALSQDAPTVARLAAHLPAVLHAILARRAPDTALFRTEETPADDPLPLPYHFSSQVLLWHTLRRLAPLNARLAFTSLDLVGLADSIRAAVWQHMVAEHQHEPLFAYATDLRGTYRFYHDANDFPTVLAPSWGFCCADDPIWRATMAFAFSPANQGGYYPGPLGGLGSVHTPGAWPLGDVQELIYARLTGDDARWQAVLARLAATACWDGALPEARDPTTGAVRSRHWFGWPGAALAATLTNPAWRL